MEPKSVAGGVANVAYYLPKALAKKVNITYFPPFAPKKDYLVNLLNIYRKFLKKEFDIIHFNFAPTWINVGSMLLRFAKKRGAHTVLNIHGLIPLEHKLKPAQGPIPYMALSNTLRHCKVADRIIVNSEYMRTEVIAWYGINRDKIVVIPNGVDTKKFRHVKRRTNLSGDPAILFVGRVEYPKGISILVESMKEIIKELPDAVLHVVGNGRLMNQLKGFVTSNCLDNSVIFHGQKTIMDVPSFYSSADICAFPSTDHEAFGITIIEAMAAGKPIISTRKGAIPENVENFKNGVLVEPEKEDLKKAIVSLWNNKNLMEKISKNNLEKAKYYDWSRIADQYICLYHDTLSRSFVRMVNG